MYTVKVLIPFISRLRATHWERSVRLLNRTISSVLFQDNPGGYVVLVGHDKPPLHNEILSHGRFQFVKVHYDPSSIHPSVDKAHKLAYGLMASAHIDAAWQMALDADDVLHKRLVGWLASCSIDVGGFIVSRGYQLDFLSKRGYPCDNLQQICGSTIILRSDLVRSPQSSKQNEFQGCIWYYNGHQGIPTEMAKAGFPLCDIPFRALLYTVNHGGDWHKIYKQSNFFASMKRLVKFSPFISASPARLRHDFAID